MTALRSGAGTGWLASTTATTDTTQVRLNLDGRNARISVGPRDDGSETWPAISVCPVGL